MTYRRVGFDWLRLAFNTSYKHMTIPSLCWPMEKMRSFMPHVYC